MISIIIPIFNTELYLDECIDSILKQTYTDWECILVNDGSTDKSGEICDTWAKKDQRLNVIHQTNQGVSSARNKGIQYAKGEYIYFLDSDDRIAINCLELLYKQAIQYNNPDIVCANIKTFGISTIHFPFPTEISYINNNQSIQQSYYNHEWYEMPFNKLIKKDFIIKNCIYFYNGIRHEDTLWSFTTALYADSILLIPNLTYFYRIHNNSFITSRNYKLSSESLLVVCSQMKKNIKNTGGGKDAKNYFIDFSTNIYLSYFLNKDFSSGYKYKAYKTVRNLLHDIELFSFLFQTKYPVGIKLLQIHQIFPTLLGYCYIYLFNYISKLKSKFL